MNCENCDRPLATKQDAKDIPPGEGEYLCWGACEPEDWRARALKAERERDEARAEVERLRASVENLDSLYASRTDSLRECEADVELWKKEAEEKQADFAMWFRLANDERKLTSQLRAEVERLRSNQQGPRNYVHKAFHEQMLGRVAERQREADIDHCLVWLGHANVSVPLDEFMRETPLVTEGDK